MGVSYQVFRGSQDGSIVSSEISCDLESNQVFIETTHSGVCGTDEAFLHSGQALGHEGIGIVQQVAPDVDSVRVGDRVGFAYVLKVCSSCDNCITGEFLLSTTLISPSCVLEVFNGKIQDTISIVGWFASTGNATLTLGLLDLA